MVEDIRLLSAEAVPRSVSLLTAGFPCQDLSQAGQTAGINGGNSGLVRRVFRLLRALHRDGRRPWVLLENVPFMLHLDKGAAMEYVVSALETLGYRWAYRVVDSACFGLPQRRRRVFLVACVDADPRLVLLSDDAGTPPAAPATGKAQSWGFYWTEGNRGLGWGVNLIPPLKGGSSLGVPSPPAICMPDGSIVVPSLRDAERLQGFPVGWTAPAEAVTTPRHRWKLIGNAVNVRAAHWLGLRLAHPAPAYRHGGEPLPRGGAWPSAAWNVGAGRFSAPVSPWPRATKFEPIHAFLRYKPTPLSRRATEGFLSRLLASRLRHDAAFIAALKAHVKKASSNELPRRQAKRGRESRRRARAAPAARGGRS